MSTVTNEVEVWLMEFDVRGANTILCGDEAIPAYRFAHQAMATIFEIISAHEDRVYAEQAARAAFALIDRLEADLSCHRSSSDISRINRLPSDAETTVGLCTLECLLMARYFYRETRGAFDVALGSGLESVEMITAERRIRVHAQDVRLDLGGIGKGYAVDRAGDLLREWEVGRSVVHGGFSSVLVMDPPSGRQGWPLTVSIPGSVPVIEVEAHDQAWSASGIRKKDHILDPRTGVPVRNRPGAWVSGSTDSLSAAWRKDSDLAVISETSDSPAAVAEALSTAFMILPLPEIADYCLHHPGIEARVLVSDPSSACGAPVMVHINN